MDTTRTHEQIYNATHQDSYPLGHYLNDATYDMPNEGEYEDMRMPGQDYIICTSSFTGASVDDQVTFNEEQLIKFDSFDSFIGYVKRQPRKGAVRFTKERYMIGNLNFNDVIAGCQSRGHYYDVVYSNGAFIAMVETYRYDGTLYLSMVSTLYNEGQIIFPLYVEEYRNPISLESASFSREFGPKYNGQVFYKVSRSWKTLEPDETDIEGNGFTPETPPWLKRIENLSVSHESVEESVEYVYPDWKNGDAWTLHMIKSLECDTSIDKGLRSNLIRYIRSYFGGDLEKKNHVSNVSLRVNMAVRNGNWIDHYKEKKSLDWTKTHVSDLWKGTATYKTETIFTHRTFSPGASLGFDNEEYAADEAEDVSVPAFVYNEEYESILSMYSIPFVNSAGVAMEAQGSRQILKMDFSYNVKDFDFEAPAYFMNKVNDRAITIAGVTYGPKTVLIQDIGAEYKIDYNEDASVKWTYWNVKISLLIDNRTFNKEYANLGTHVLETSEYIRKKGSLSFDDCVFSKYAYRIGSGPNKGMILSQEKYNELVDSGVDFYKTFGCEPARITVYTSNPQKMAYAEHLDSFINDTTGESSTLKWDMAQLSHSYGNDQLIALGIAYQDMDENGNPIYDSNGNPVMKADTQGIANGEYEIVKQRSLQRIYHMDGHYYTKSMLNTARPNGEQEPISESMFLSMDGTKLSPFMSNSKQMPTYLKGCIYDSANFEELGIPVVG